MNNQSIPANDWLTASEAAQYLKVKPRTLLLWVRQGKVKGFALSGTKRHVWRFRQIDLDAAVLESAVLPSQSPSVRPAERMDQ
jgi:excisionase family DNA binding protein